MICMFHVDVRGVLLHVACFAFIFIKAKVQCNQTEIPFFSKGYNENV